MGIHGQFTEVPMAHDTPLEFREQLILEAVKKHPEKKMDFYAHLYLKFLDEKMYVKATEYNNLAIEASTNGEDLGEQYYRQSLIHIYQENPKEAIVSIIKSLEAFPNSGDYISKLGELYEEIGDFKKAKLTYDKLLTLPEDADEDGDWRGSYYESCIAGLYAAQKDLGNANKIYNKKLKEAKDDYTKAGIYRQLAFMYRDAGNIKDAIANSKKSIKHRPEETAYILDLAHLYANNKQYKEAKKTYDLILPIIEKNDQNKLNSVNRYYSGLGEMYVTMGKYEEAIECYKKELTYYKEDKQPYGPLKEIAAIYFQQRRYSESEPYLLKIIELYPNRHPRAYSSMATINYMVNKDAENAINYMRLAAKANYQSDENIQGNDAETAGMIYGFIGKLYYDDYNDEELAIENFEKALQCEPDKAIEQEIYDSLYAIYMNRGDEEKAKECKEKRSPIKMLQSMFAGDWTPPPALSLDERLRNPKNTSEEIQGLPYHYSKIPKGVVEKSNFMKKLQRDLENDLTTNPMYKEFFDKHDPYYNRDFIIAYCKHKVNLIDNHKWWKDPEDSFHDIIFRQERMDLLELILQKKLFNMQLLWRAEQITIPEIKIAYDFDVWCHKIFDCPFLEPITEKELGVLKEYVLREDFTEANHSYLGQMQHYDTIMDENEDGQKENVPAWYEFYDEKMNTGNLMLLPNTRGEKEHAYMQKYYTWKNSQPPDVPVTPAEPYVYLPSLHPMDEHYTLFVEQFENDYICTFHQGWLNHKVHPDETYDEDAVSRAFTELENSEEPPIMEGGLPWHEAIIKCANTYKNKKLAAHLDESYADYKMKIELNLPFPEGILANDFNTTHSQTLLDMILKAREVNGEPRDTNF